MRPTHLSLFLPLVAACAVGGSPSTAVAPEARGQAVAAPRTIAHFDAWAQSTAFAPTPAQQARLDRGEALIGVAPADQLPMIHSNGVVEVGPTAWTAMKGGLAYEKDFARWVDLGLFDPTSGGQLKTALLHPEVVSPRALQALPQGGPTTAKTGGGDTGNGGGLDSGADGADSGFPTFDTGSFASFDTGGGGDDTGTIVAAASYCSYDIHLVVKSETASTDSTSVTNDTCSDSNGEYSSISTHGASITADAYGGSPDYGGICNKASGTVTELLRAPTCVPISMISYFMRSGE